MSYTKAEHKEIVRRCHPAIFEPERQPGWSDDKISDRIIERALFTLAIDDPKVRSLVPADVIQSAQDIIDYVRSIPAETYALGGLDDPNHPVQAEDESEESFNSRRAAYHVSTRESQRVDTPAENFITRFLRNFDHTT